VGRYLGALLVAVARRRVATMMPIAVAAARVSDSRPKRMLDIGFALVGLLVTVPVWVVVPILIRLDDGGPVLFRQSRSGRHGREFMVTKFRSMRVDAERHGARQAVAGDARVTRVGRWLRATAMDEVPQLWNILVGDMSVVGPRALRPGEIEAIGDGTLVPLEAVPGFEVRSLVRPGLTGVAQIYASRNLPRRLKFRYDRLYIRRYSLWWDVRLILLSIWVSVSGRWEHRGHRR
jgi:lipopolysaccharide/colanic/teichoic acid biosynthesis glycosyltransferase